MTPLISFCRIKQAVRSWMVRERSLANELHIGAVDDDELSTVLSSVLPRGAQFRPGEVEYRTMADEWVLSLRYRDGAVVDAISGPAMTAELEQQLVDAIEQELLAPSSMKVCRCTMFSERPVEGSWRYKDQFQLVPAPPEAPRPGVLFGEHPFIVDLTFLDSRNHVVRNLRYSRQAYELELLLNLLLTPTITAPTNRGRHHWVLVPSGSESAVLWANEGYLIPDFRYLVDDLPDISAFAPLTEVEAEAYYDLRKSYSDTLTIPNRLEALVDAFNALEGDDRTRFLRACYWFHMAGTLWDYSQSLHLTSLINAIECLASIGPGRSEPEGPSKLFKEFMRHYAPGKPSGTKLDKLYEVRSDISHGERLLHYDQPPSAIGLSQAFARDSDAGDDAVVLSRGALLNWLWQHHPSSSGLLLTQGLPKSKPAKPGTKSSVTIVTPDH